MLLTVVHFTEGGQPCDISQFGRLTTNYLLRMAVDSICKVWGLVSQSPDSQWVDSSGTSSIYISQFAGMRVSFSLNGNLCNQVIENAQVSHNF